MSSRKGKTSKIAEPVPEPEPEVEDSAFDTGLEPEELEDSIAYEYDMMGSVANAVLGNYFQYQHTDGTILNIADLLLLIRESIDRNTEMLQKVHEQSLKSKV